MTPTEWFFGGLLFMILANQQEPKSWWGVFLASIGLGWVIVAAIERVMQ